MFGSLWGGRRARRDGRLAASVAVLGVLPVVALAALTQDGYGARSVLVTSALVTHVFVLTAGGLVYWRWRVGSTLAADDAGQRQLSGWLTVGLLVSGMQGLVTTAPLVDSADRPDRWMLLDEVVLLTVLCAAMALADRVCVPGDPAAVGLLLGLGLSGLYVVGVLVDWLGVPGWLSPALAAAALLLALLLAWLLLCRAQAHRWVRRRLALSAVALTAAGTVLGVDAPHVALLLGAAVADLAGALVICLTMQTLLRGVLAEQQEEVSALNAALDEFSSGLAHQRELLHELSSTIAGIASAAQLQRRVGLPLERRRRLESMLDAELARVLRLVSPARAAAGAGTVLDVDEVVGTIVVSHQARGRAVRWEPTGLMAAGDADDLAEVVNVLLENAARHAPGAQVSVEAHGAGDDLEIRVRDDGPGIPPDLVDRVFDPEARSASTGGQGLGLAIARRLMGRAGGGIELEETGPAGTTFVLRIPTSGVSCDLDVVA